jgi:hypothetical protein
MKRAGVIIVLASLLAISFAALQVGLGSYFPNSSVGPTVAHAGGLCYNYGCDYKDVVAYQCLRSPLTVDTVYNTARSGGIIATTRLKWSDDCAANWVETSVSAARDIYSELDRDTGSITWVQLWGAFARTQMLGGLFNLLRGCSMVLDFETGTWSEYKCTAPH